MPTKELCPAGKAWITPCQSLVEGPPSTCYRGRTKAPGRIPNFKDLFLRGESLPEFQAFHCGIYVGNQPCSKDCR